MEIVVAIVVAVFFTMAAWWWALFYVLKNKVNIGNKDDWKKKD